jgi:hypothetical protein
MVHGETRIKSARGERLTGEISQIFVSFENWILWSAMTSERLFWRHNHENN